MTNVVSQITKRIDGAQKIIADAVEMYKMNALAALFSGGHDSLLTAYLTSRHPAFAGVVYANTLTGAKQTRSFIYDACERYQWKLYEGKPLITYEMLIIRYGYPSPITHPMMYRHLKDRTFDRMRGEIARTIGCKSQEVAYTSGIRRWESRKRMLTAKPITVHYVGKSRKKIKRVLISPCWDFSISERDDAIAHLGLKRNEFADFMGHSYECQDGANQEHDERARRSVIAPQYEEIERLREQLVMTAYELQQKMVEYGVIDADDAQLSSDRLKWGWHIDTPISEEQLAQINDEFALCQSCVSQRALDGTAGIDPDKPSVETIIPRADFIDRTPLIHRNEQRVSRQQFFLFDE